MADSAALGHVAITISGPALLEKGMISPVLSKTVWDENQTYLRLIDRSLLQDQLDDLIVFGSTEFGLKCAL